jgi:prenyltransferase beta subunit
MSDVFHTFFEICGLSLLMNRFEAFPSTNGEKSIDSNGGGGSCSYRAIDPTYALPVDVIRRLGVTAQTLPTVS